MFDICIFDICYGYVYVHVCTIFDVNVERFCLPKVT